MSAPSKSKDKPYLVLGVASCLLLSLLLPPLTHPLQAQNVSLGLSLTDGRVKSFYFSISSYFGVPEATVIRIREQYRLSDEELPVIFFLASEARVEPAVIINLRLRGMSWWDISLHFRLSPEIFFLPVTLVRIGPPYGRAYGYYRQHRHQKEWGRVVLTDVEIVDLVNLKFASAYHQVSPERIMEMRAKGHKFIDIHDTIIKEKGKGKGKDQPQKNNPGKKPGQKQPSPRGIV